MANDDFDNRKIDDEMFDRLVRRGAREHPTAHIDIHTAPDRVDIYLNPAAVTDIMAKLQTVLSVCLPSANICITLIRHQGKTLLEIGADDYTTPS